MEPETRADTPTLHYFVMAGALEKLEVGEGPVVVLPGTLDGVF